MLFKLRRGRAPATLPISGRCWTSILRYCRPKPPASRPSDLPYVLSGFAGLDEFLGGFQRSDLVIVAGRPSMGKTSLALNIARNAAVEHRACVALFSLEMARDSLVTRLLSSEVGRQFPAYPLRRAQDARTKKGKSWTPPASFRKRRSISMIPR